MGVCKKCAFSDWVIQVFFTASAVFLDLANTEARVICWEQPDTNLAVLSGLWGAMCWLRKLALVNCCGCCQRTYTCSAVTPNLKWCSDHSPFNTQCGPDCPLRAVCGSKYIHVQMNNITWQLLTSLWSSKSYAYFETWLCCSGRRKAHSFWRAGGKPQLHLKTLDNVTSTQSNIFLEAKWFGGVAVLVSWSRTHIHPHCVYSLSDWKHKPSLASGN